MTANRKAFLFLLLLFPVLVIGQQEFTLHFNRAMVQSSYTNPAIMSQHKVVIALPSVVYNYGNNAFSYYDLIKRDPNSDSTFFNVDGVLDQMSANNIIQVQSYVDWFGFYFAVKDWQFSFNITDKVDLKFLYPRDLVNLMWNGNVQYIGQSTEIGPGLSMQIYKEYGFRLARHFEKWDVGMRFKLLNGIANLHSVRNSMTLTTGEQNYSSSLSTDYEIREAGLRDFQAQSFVPFSESVNRGYAFDLGAIYRINEKWEVSASVIDLGRIKWQDSVRIHKSNGDFVFSGVDLNEFFDEDEFDTQAFEDSIADLYFESEEGRSYISNLVPKTYLSAAFHPDEKTSFSALVHMEFIKGVQPGFALYAGREIASFLNMGLSYSYKNRRWDNLGFNLNLGMPAFTIYVVTDNLFNFVRMGYGRNVTFRYGMNINIAKLGIEKKKKRKKKEEEEEEEKEEEL